MFTFGDYQLVVNVREPSELPASPNLSSSASSVSSMSSVQEADESKVKNSKDFASVPVVSTNTAFKIEAEHIRKAEEYDSQCPPHFLNMIDPEIRATVLGPDFVEPIKRVAFTLSGQTDTHILYDYNHDRAKGDAVLAAVAEHRQQLFDKNDDEGGIVVHMSTNRPSSTEEKNPPSDAQGTLYELASPEDWDHPNPPKSEKFKSPLTAGGLYNQLSSKDFELAAEKAKTGSPKNVLTRTKNNLFLQRPTAINELNPSEKAYFHNEIKNSAEAEAHLKDKSVGSFIIRHSSTGGPRCLAITAKCVDKSEGVVIAHFQVRALIKDEMTRARWMLLTDIDPVTKKLIEEPINDLVESFSNLSVTRNLQTVKTSRPSKTG